MIKESCKAFNHNEERLHPKGVNPTYPRNISACEIIEAQDELERIIIEKARAIENDFYSRYYEDSKGQKLDPIKLKFDLNRLEQLGKSCGANNRRRR